MLKDRLLSAFIIVSISLLFVYLDMQQPIADCPGAWMYFLGFYLVFGSAFECARMVGGSALGKITLPALIGCAGIMLAAGVPLFWPVFNWKAAGSGYPEDCLLGALGWPLAASAFALVGAFAWYMPTFKPNEGFLVRAILSGWVAVYFGICFSFAIALRLVGESAWGLFLLVGVIVITKFADTGAYFCGRAFGRTKLCPAVSPGKTVEGLVGGMAVASIAGWIYFSYAGNLAFKDAVTVRWIGVITLGVGLTIAGVFGDLVESIVKRETGFKDSGKTLPGLGGLWDVTDSLLPSMVVAYLIVMTEWIIGPGM